MVLVLLALLWQLVLRAQRQTGAGERTGTGTVNQQQQKQHRHRHRDEHLHLHLHPHHDQHQPEQHHQQHRAARPDGNARAMGVSRAHAPGKHIPVFGEAVLKACPLNAIGQAQAQAHAQAHALEEAVCLLSYCMTALQDSDVADAQARGLRNEVQVWKRCSPTQCSCACALYIWGLRNGPNK